MSPDRDAAVTESLSRGTTTTGDQERGLDDRGTRTRADLPHGTGQEEEGGPRGQRASTSTSPRVRSSASSAPTAPARPPRCGCWSPCSRRPPGRRGSRGTTWPPSPCRSAAASATARQVGSTFSGAYAGDEVVDHGMLYGMSRKAAVAKGQELFEKFQLDGLWQRMPKNMSGGQKRRLDIVMGLIHSPTLDVPRRADHRPRPAGAGEPLGAHRRAARQRGRDRLPDHALPRRGRRARRPDRHHRPRRDRRQRHRRQPQGAGLR